MSYICVCSEGNGGRCGGDMGDRGKLYREREEGNQMEEARVVGGPE